MVGAVGTATFVPTTIRDEFSALPIQIFIMSRRAAFHEVAGAAIIVLMVVLICMNGLAAFVRYRFASDIADL